VVTETPAGMHEAWQFMAVVSQAVRQAVEVDVNGSHVGGGGRTVCWASSVSWEALRATNNMEHRSS
jgi:hypothetical protein